MRRVLTVGLTICSALVVGLPMPAPGEASTAIAAYLYHPTGNAQYDAQMTCGWHDLCNGVGPDQYPKGLDWISQGPSDFAVYLRLKFFGGTAAAQSVAAAKFYDAISGCNSILVDMSRHSDGLPIGTVVNQHSLYQNTATVPLYSSASGFLNEYYAGSMVLSGDNCTTFGAHIMQWYEAASSPGTKNCCTAIPNEPGLTNPANRQPWADPWEYGFSFNTAVWFPWANKGDGGNATATGLSFERTASTSTTHLVRNSSGDIHVRELTSFWGSWTNMSTDFASSFGTNVAINNQESQVHLLGVSGGNLYWKRKEGTTWYGWLSLARPTAAAIDGPVAVAYSGGTTVVAVLVQGDVYFRKRANGVWYGWEFHGGGNTLGGSVAIANRPNGLHHIVAFRPADATVWITWWNGVSWQPLGNLGGMLDGGLGIDNSRALVGNTDPYTHKGVHIVALSGGGVHLRCWEPDCLPAAWENHGPPYSPPLDVTNVLNEVHMWPRSSGNVYEKCKC